MGGNGHNLQGSPGHKHPVHSACTGMAGIPSNKPRTSGAIIRNPPIDRVCMAILPQSITAIRRFNGNLSNCSKQSSYAGSQPHRQRAPERDAH